ncbi:hypothetical protein [Oryza sativa Japonica Group]|uniref:Uncharacterized protein n=1 Tax=Oryza sativa subsp. japonica TaxID=39947 RepID=Q656V7_ORYSJ|nr:hypothetical protein [Oryza sativa Japonica Group]BAD52555.1 hypothetical protein [Oryza sativa Japonica Group]
MSRVPTSRGFVYSRVNKLRGGARGPGPWEWGPRGSLSVHGGPGAPGLTPAGAVGPTRQPHPRARAADCRAPRGSRSARPKTATSARPAGDGAPAPLWSPAAAIGTAERRPREGRERGKRGGGPRLTQGRRRRRKRRPERRKAAARLGWTGTAALRWSASSTRGWTGRRRCGEAGGGDAGAGDGPGEREEAAGGRRRRRRERATARARFRRGEGAAKGGNGRRRCGEGLNGVGRGRGRPGKEGNRPGGPAAINGAGEICGGKSGRLNAREREGKMGGKREGITGSNSPHLNARGDGGMRRIRRRRRRLARAERREVGDDGWAPPASEGGGRARPSAARAGRGREQPDPPLGEIRRRADTSPSGPTSPKVPGHVGDSICLKPPGAILPVPYHRQ